MCLHSVAGHWHTFARLPRTHFHGNGMTKNCHVRYNRIKCLLLNHNVIMVLLFAPRARKKKTSATHGEMVQTTARSHAHTHVPIARHRTEPPKRSDDSTEFSCEAATTAQTRSRRPNDSPKTQKYISVSEVARSGSVAGK